MVKELKSRRKGNENERLSKGRVWEIKDAPLNGAVEDHMQ